MNTPMTNHFFLMEHQSRLSAWREGTDFTAWQRESRKKVSAMLGLDIMERCDDRMEILWEHDEGSFTEYRLEFNTEDSYRVPAHLLIPKGKEGPVPVIICLQGHNREGMRLSMGRIRPEEGDLEDRDYALQSVENGFAALAMEQRGFGVCGGPADADPDCHQYAMTALLMGRTLTGERAWDVMRAIDLMEKHFPMLDLSRVGMLGNSGGGLTMLYATALDERIQAVICCGYLCGFRESIGTLHHCTCNYIPGMMRHFDMGDIAALAAPRVFVAVNGKEDDIFPIEATKRQFAVMKELYRVAGAEDRCAQVIGEGGHRPYKDLAWPVFNRLTGWKRD